ncbi:OmpH family outer membrane protein [Pontivivens insulae]|uniref:Chaperone protein Skp n=1 Tax=Pontivivens insulae TaxID=1639689 RepID=A0A2R8AAS0_9RHOB|nr:OmpH family outer membrane protein [Pontivivens insulae]RED13214.1 periplasmic chaperone for outer membrane proteins Skp [Pontivivens insulae]SPF29306.1 hypothetical protein POI8812_01614 [Pontivivens insulae]
MVRLGAALLALMLMGTMAMGQGRIPPLLLVNPQQVLERSETGRALIAENQEAREALAAESAERSDAFEREEMELTERRGAMEPEAFAALADEFDARVRAARAEQDRAGQQLARDQEAAQARFNALLTPIYSELMRESGAAAVLDIRNVVLANSQLDITREVIRRLDAAAALDDEPADQ